MRFVAPCLHSDASRLSVLTEMFKAPSRAARFHAEHYAVVECSVLRTVHSGRDTELANHEMQSCELGLNALVVSLAAFLACTRC